MRSKRSPISVTKKERFYVAELCFLKEVHDLDPVHGLDFNSRRTLRGENVDIQTKDLSDLKVKISPWVKEKTGFEFDDFHFLYGACADKNERCFGFSRRENKNGYPDEEGCHFAEYLIFVKVSKVEQMKCPRFGLRGG